MMLAAHSLQEVLYVLLGSFTAGAGWSIGRWLVSRVLK